MNKEFFFISKVVQKDRQHFSIEWTDGVKIDYNLPFLQEHCPCARCLEHRNVDPSVSARKIKSVGRYALQIEFTSGCSKGIYSFEFLRGIGCSKNALF